MHPSLPPAVVWGVIILAVLLDAGLIVAMRKMYGPQDIRSRITALKKAFSAGVSNYQQHAASIRAHLIAAARLALVLVCILIPSFLVVRDFWFHSPLRLGWLDTIKTVLPSYFFVTTGCIFAVFMLVIASRAKQPTIFISRHPSMPTTGNAPAYQRTSGYLLVGLSAAGFAWITFAICRQAHIPGWDLALVFCLYLLGWALVDFSFTQSLHRQIKANGSLCWAMLIGHIGYVLFLYRIFDRPEHPWVYDVFFVVALVQLARHWRRVPPIYWIVSLAMLLFTLNINSWWYAAWGDEGAFFEVGRYLAQERSVTEIGELLFNGRGVYESHPYFSSMLHALFMRAFGAHNFGWRFSSLYLSALAIGFFYLFFKAFVSQRLAIFTSVFLAASHYVMSFGKIGYNNLQALLAMGVVLWAGARAVQSQKLAAFAVLGVSLGACFYTYPAALYTIPLPLLLLLLYNPPRSKPALLRWCVTLLTLLALAIPLLVQPKYWQEKMPGTFLEHYSPNAAREITLQEMIGGIREYFQSETMRENTIYAFFSFLYLPYETHFVSTAYMDPLSGGLILVGIAVLLKQLRHRFSWFLILGFVFILFSVGVSHGREYPPTTRMFLLLPYFAILAALGLEWIVEQLSHIAPPRQTKIIYSAILVTMIGLNTYLAYHISPYRVNAYLGLESIFVRLAGETVRLPRPITFAFLTDQEESLYGMYFLQNLYKNPETPNQIRQIIIADGKLPPESLELLQSPDTIVLPSRSIRDDQLKQALGLELQGLGKTSCVVKNASGIEHYPLWFSGELGTLCH